MKTEPDLDEGHPLASEPTPYQADALDLLDLPVDSPLRRRVLGLVKPPREPERHDPLELDPYVDSELLRSNLIALKGKAPFHTGWRERRYNPLKLRRRLARGAGNVGVRLGPELIVIDIDPRADKLGRSADELLGALEAHLNIDLSGAPKVRSGSGGLHAYLAKPRDAWTMKARELLAAFGKAIEFKGEGRQMVAAGSLHPDTGRTYRWEGRDGWVNDKLLLPFAPRELLEALSDAVAPAGASAPATAIYERQGWESELPPPRVEELLRSCPKIRARYERHADGLKDETASGVDLSLATQLALRGCEGWEIDAAIRCSRAAGGAREKHDAAIRLTVSKALAYAAEQRLADPREVFAEDAAARSAEATRSQDELGRQAARFAKRMVTGPQWVRETPPPPVVDGLLVGRGVVNLFGPPGAGKTYIALSLGLAIAAKHPKWLGRALYLSGRVAYFAAEGEYSLINRLRAYEKERGPIPEDFHVLRGGIRLGIKYDRQDALAWLEEFQPALVVVDTLSAASAGADENATADMGPFIEWFLDVSRRTGALVIFVHHPTKADANSSRGAGVLEANVDGVVQVSNGRIRAKKIRSSSLGRPISFALRTVDLGEDPERPGRQIEDALVEVRHDIEPELEVPLIVDDLARERGWDGVWLANVVERYAKQRNLSGDKSTAERAVKRVIPIGREKAGVDGLYRLSSGRRQPWRIYNANMEKDS